MKKFGTLLGIAVLVLLLALAIAEWWTGGNLSGRKENGDYAWAKSLLSENKPYKARAVIEKYSSQFSENPGDKPNWLDLEIKDLAAMPQDSRNIVGLYQTFPKAFENQNEKTILLLAAQLINQRDFDDFEKLKTEWASKTTEPGIWFGLQSDSLAVQGKVNDAIALLKGKHFEGKNDLPRLLRLAFLTSKTNIEETWNLLNQAIKIDPSNTEAHIYRAQILEQLNKLPLARLEYIAAIQGSPKDPFIYDQLAEFLLRYGEIQSALSIWNIALQYPNSDQVWVKSIFWSKVGQPFPFEWKKLQIPDGPLNPLIQYLLNLKPNEFWNSAAFEKLINGGYYLRTQQATFWLRLIQTLMSDKPGDALNLLQYSTFKESSWSPSIEHALEQILTYRKTGSLQIDSQDQQTLKRLSPNSTTMEQTYNHAFFKDLNELSQYSSIDLTTDKMPKDLRNLLMSSEAYAAPFLAGMWLEAAWALHQMSVIPADFPLWYAFGLTQTIRILQGPMQALEFATKQPPSPPLNLLIGELLIFTGNVEALRINSSR